MKKLFIDPAWEFWQHTVDPYYLGIPYLWICYNLFLTPKSILGALHGHLWTCTEQWRIWVDHCIHSHVKSNKAIAFLFLPHTVNQYPFCSQFRAIFFTFFCFLFVISLFKMAPNHNAEVLSSVPKYKRLWCVLWRNTCVR